MAEWTGTWKSGPVRNIPCKCGNPKGAIEYTHVFEAEEFNAMGHDGETRTEIEYVCPVCKAAYHK